MFRRDVLGGILSLSLLPLVAKVTGGVAYAKIVASSREYFASIERDYVLPDALLYSIALAESGKKTEGIVSPHPHPWTVGVNIGGVLDGHFFKDKSGALLYASSLMNKNFDLGLCQISHLYHRARFISISHMLDPSSNVHFAASLLREGFDRTHSWRSAIGLYHAGERSFRSFPSKYFSRVVYHWYRERSL